MRGTSSNRGLAQSQPEQGDIWRAEQRHHSHFTGSKLEQVLGIPLTRVAYRGSAPAITDLIGGHLPFAIVTIADAIPQHRGWRSQNLGRQQRRTLAVSPDVPTLKESGVDLVADGWYGMWLPAASSQQLRSNSVRRWSRHSPSGRARRNCQRSV